MSTISSFHHKLKIYGIVKLKTDVILLSDIRIPENVSTGEVKKLERSFLTNPYGSYNFFFHSGANSRGVGVLIKNSVPFVVDAVEKDANYNTLGVVLTIEGKKILLLSIYGPNKPCDDFFPFIEKIITKYSQLPVLIGGDWNLTPSSLPADINPDVFSMSNLPNEKHSKLLAKLQLKFSLVDPFRILHPNRHDFSYVPRDQTKKIDLVSIFFYFKALANNTF
jgi:exonuclease III